MRFEWDPVKAAANVKSHKVPFAEAITVFDDPFHATIRDPSHSETEERWLTIGLSTDHRLLVVSHTEDATAIGVISARRASRTERRLYEEER